VEFLIQILGELLLQMLGQLLVELGFHGLAGLFRRPQKYAPNPWMDAIGYALFGALVGAVSLWVFPAYLTPIGVWRWLNFVVTPLMAGFSMVLLGKLRARRGDPLLRMDHFAYGYLFALAVAVVRLQCARWRGVRSAWLYAF
jgi:hypothetical protein